LPPPRLSRRLSPVGPVALLLTLAGAPARGGALDDPHVGGVGFSGPTTGDLSAIYWNPAALGLMSGGQAMLGLSAQRTTVSVERVPIDASGAPGGGRAFLPVTGHSTNTPLSWPPGPGTFAAIGASIANRFTLALAVYTPSFQRTSFPATADGEQPTRYHGVEIDLRNVALLPALALRIGNELRIGVAPGFLFSTGRLVFDEDTALNAPPPLCDAAPCPAESAAAAARYDVGSGLGVFDSTLSFTVAGGIHYRRDEVEAGVSISSRPLGSGVEVDAERTTVTPPPRLGPNAVVCPPDHPNGCVSARIRYDLPDTVTGGVTWHITPRTAVTGIARWITFSRHGQIVMRVVGPASGGLRTAGLPERIVLHRGFRNVIEGRLRLEHEPRPWLRVGLAVRADNGAVPARDLSPIAVDGPAFEPAAMAELRVGRWLRLAVGYAFTVMPARDSGASVFDPVAATTCASAAVAGNLLDPSCDKQVSGEARPTATGRYALTQHTATLTTTFRF
jgi:long-subunit fatty acid transport protein